jgi:hypothetical protein
MKGQDMEDTVWTAQGTGMDRTVSAVGRTTISVRTDTAYRASATK